MLLTLKPSLYGPHYFLARIHYKQGKFREALPFLERALKLQPENIEACRQLASTHVALKAFSRGIASYRSCLKMDPRQMEVLYDLGVVYMNLAAAVCLTTWLTCQVLPFPPLSRHLIMPT